MTQLQGINFSWRPSRSPIPSHRAQLSKAKINVSERVHFMKACPPGRPRSEFFGTACRASGTHPIPGQNIVNLFAEIIRGESAQNEIEPLEDVDSAQYRRLGRLVKNLYTFKVIVLLFCHNASPISLGSRKARHSVTFLALHDRLVLAIRFRICNGQISERGLARMVGVSQPHVHNVIKGVRSLSPKMSDRILEGLGMTVLDLVGEAAWQAALSAPWPRRLPPGRSPTPPGPSVAS
jgi:hypothetical protein